MSANGNCVPHTPQHCTGRSRTFRHSPLVARHCPAAHHDSSNNVFYYFSDHLGTSRMLVQAGQTTACYNADFFPFGKEAVDVTDTCPPTHKFTGKERDTESLNDYFGARYYGNTMGRFLTPDWDAKPISVPYADFGNPQSLNLYTYVGNNPLRDADPDGHCDANDWCGSLAGVAKGAASFLVDTAKAVAVSAIPGYGAQLTGEAAAAAVVTAAQDYSDKGVSGVTNQLLAQGVEGATATVTEAVLTGGFAASSRVSSIAPEAPSGTLANAAKGAASEATVLSDIGEVKNTQPVTGSEGKSIPDFQNSRVVGEIKDAKTVSNTRQLRIQKEAAQQSGRQHELYTGTKTNVTSNAARGTTVVRRDDLGPQ